MTELFTRDVNYSDGETLMRGLLVAEPGIIHAPAIMLIHDAFGLGEDTIMNAQKLAKLGYSVFAADVWGDRFTPNSEQEIGPLIGSMVSDRERWHARITAAYEAAILQPEIDPGSLVMLGFCFGGSSALEYLRHGGKVAGVVSIHAGLDLLEWDWSAADSTASVLIATGSEDPMANDTDRQRLQAELSVAGIDWQLNLYSDTKHAFTNPKSANSPNKNVIDYSPLSAARAWLATEHFLTETLKRPAQIGA